MVLTRMGDTASRIVRTRLGTKELLPGRALILTAAPPSAGDRVEMAKRGASIVGSSPSLTNRKAPFPGNWDQGGTMGRGFLIAIGTLSGLEFKPDAMRQTLSAIEQSGFDAGVAAFKSPALTQSVNAPSPDGGGSSKTPIIVGAAVVGLAAVAAVAWKMKKKR